MPSERSAISEKRRRLKRADIEKERNVFLLEMQEFRVVQCSECQTFQVNIVSKAKKWSCKLCDTKQTVKTIYFSSYAAKDCRERVQQMNKHFNRAKALESEELIEGSESREWSDRDSFNAKQVDSKPEMQIGRTEQAYKYKRFGQDMEDQKDNSRQESNFLYKVNPKEVKSNSSAKSSVEPSSLHILKPTELPGFTNFNKDPTTSNLRCRPSSQPEPSAKKLKLSDDDFEVSQEDLDLIDSLE